MCALTRAGLVSALALAALLSGCGSGGHAHDRGGASTAWTTYAGPNFQLSYPASWPRPTTTGAAGANLAASTTSPDGRATIVIHSYLHSTKSIIQALRDVATSDAAEEQAGQMRVLSNSLSTPAVAGAAQTKELDQVFENRAGRQRLRELLVMTPSGTLIDLETSASTKAAGFDPARVIASFKLTGTSA